MRAWVGIAQDPVNYGTITALTFPKGEYVAGSQQVESIISQDTEISKRISLWGRVGSRVLRGNLLVLPVKGDVIYIEPLYLSAAANPYPMLKRVIAVYSGEAEMGSTLKEAVRSVLKRRTIPTPEENIKPIENMVKPLYQTVQRYLNLSKKYNQLIRQGKYPQAGFVRENIAELKENMANIIERWEFGE